MAYGGSSGKLLWRWLSLLLHRQVEYAADRYAVEATRNHAAFIDGLKRLAAVQPRNVFPNFLDALGMNSHACVLWRIRRIERLRKAFDEEAGEKSVRRSRQLK
jgi:Zn-dependent protease with chaperone function